MIFVLCLWALGGLISVFQIATDNERLEIYWTYIEEESTWWATVLTVVVLTTLFVLGPLLPVADLALRHGLKDRGPTDD